MDENIEKTWDQLVNQSKEHSSILEAIGKFSGKLGHDFNNILASIQGCSELMKIKLGKLHPDANPLEKQIKIIEASIKKGVELTSKIRAFSRPGPLETQQMELKSLVESVIQTIKSSGVTKADIELVVQANPTVETSGFLVTQILVTLCSNAIDAMSKLQDRTLLVFLNEEEVKDGSDSELKAGTYGRISIIDHGTGIKNEHKSKLFEPFFSTKSGGVGEGMGLGLSMALEVMRKLDGTIRLQSESGRGTAAHLYMPIVKS